MPRLPVWAALMAGAGGAGYVSYHVYTPRLATQRASELYTEAEKMEPQRILQSFAALRSSLESPAAMYASASAGAPQTNAEKLLLYLELQLLRLDTYALARKLQSMKDRKAILREMDAVQTTLCTSLNFRDDEPTLLERVQCFVAYCTFTVAGCWLLTALSCVLSEARRRYLMHCVCRWIMRHLLDTEVSMTFDDESVFSGEAEGAGDRPLVLVLSPEMWVETAAFWSSPRNPLLRCTSACLCNTSDPSRRYAGHTRAVSGMESPSAKGTVTPSAASTAAELSMALSASIPFERYWSESWSQELAMDTQPHEAVDALPAPATTGERMPLPVSTSAPTATLSQVGYPLAAACRISQRAAQDELLFQPALVPVAPVGLPRITYVGKALSKPDVRQRATRNDKYQILRGAQFSQVSAPCAEDRSRLSQPSAAGTAADQLHLAEELRALHAAGGRVFGTDASVGGELLPIARALAVPPVPITEVLLWRKGNVVKAARRDGGETSAATTFALLERSPYLPSRGHTSQGVMSKGARIALFSLHGGRSPMEQRRTRQLLIHIGTPCYSSEFGRRALETQRAAIERDREFAAHIA